MKIIYLILYLLTLIKGQFPTQFNKVVLNKRYQQSRCDSQNLLSDIYSGNQLFSGDSNGQTTVPYLILSGWYMMRQYGTSDNFLMTLRENTNQIEINVGYNLHTQLLFLEGKDSTSVKDQKYLNPDLKNSWSFFIVEMNYNSPKLVSTVNFFNKNQEIELTTEQNLSGSAVTPFIKTQIQLTFGNLNVMKDQSCTINSQYVLYWLYDNQKFNKNILLEERGDLSSGDTYLYSYFDNFYTAQNRGYLMSTGLSQNPILLSHQRTDSQKIQNNEVIMTDFINISQEQGIIMTFQAKLSDPALINQIILLKLYSQNEIVISFTGNKQIIMNNRNINDIDYSIWNHFILIIKNQFSPRVFLSIRDTFDKTVTINFEKQIVLGQFQFGDSTNTQSIYVSNIRIYKGNYLAQFPNCQLAVLQQNFQCLACYSGYSIDYSQNLGCSQNTAIPLQSIDGVVDVSRVLCPSNMINDPINYNTCICTYGYFKTSSNTCERCPAYCAGCTSATQCINKDQKKDTFGNCPSQFFDDGYECIYTLQKFILTNKQNIVEPLYFSNSPNFSQINTVCGGSTNWQNNFYTVSLDVQSATNYFISFGFSFLPNTSINTVVFSYTTPNYQMELTLKYDTQNSVYYLKYSNNYSAGVHNFLINEKEEVWVGIFVSTNILLTVNSNGAFKARNFGSGSYSTNFEIQYGNNPNGLNNGCVSLSLVKPLQLIKEIGQSSEKSNFFNFFRSDRTILAQFSVDKSNLDYAQYSFNQLLDQQINIQKLQFPNSLTQFNNVQGFTFTNEHYGFISSFQNNSKCALTFYFVIQIFEIHMQTPLISYEMNGFQVSIYLIPLHSSDTITLRICFGPDCQDGSTSFFFLKKISFIIINSNQNTPFSKEIYFQNFEIVCNYKRENLSFVGNYIDFGNRIDNFKIGYFNQKLNPYNYTVTNFNIIEGDGFFYYSYDTDSCFAYLNLSQMKCLFLKFDYVYCDNQIMFQFECAQIAYNSHFQYFYNQYTQTFTLTPFLKNKCNSIGVDDNTNSVVCTDPNSPYFHCEIGYYLDFTTQKCLKCSPQCAQCQDSSTNCTVCKYPQQQTLPSCSCLSSDQYLDSNQECKHCSHQCSQCLEKDFQCTECAINRINPPYCKCDPNIFTTIRDNCVKISCDIRCSNCVDSYFNCTQCSLNRENPPLCDCIQGFQENSDGMCSACKNDEYYDNARKKCIVCAKGCNECAGQLCLECLSPLIISENSCVCKEKDQSFLVTKDENERIEIQCLSSMTVSVESHQQSGYYDIIIKFSNLLNPIDFSQQSFSSLVGLSFPTIPDDRYILSNPKVVNNQIVVQLQLHVSISKVQGYMLFLQNQKFMSKDKQEVLSSYYTQHPIPVIIGPFFIIKDSASQNIDNAAQMVLDSQVMKGSMMNVLSKIQFFFYILNTLQPSAMFLLLQATYPPHLYKFYQLIGKLLYPFVPDYQSEERKSRFSFFGIDIHQKDISLTRIQPYKKFGFSQSLLLNIPLVFLKYLILFCCWVIFAFLKQLSNSQFQQYFRNATLFIQTRLDSENEINMLVLMISLLVQFFDIDQSSWMFRIGYYSMLLIIVYLSYYFYKSYQIINNSRGYTQKTFFLERVTDNSSWLKRNYFLIQYVKKYVVIIIIFSLYGYPIIICIINCVLFFLSSISTLFLKPYKSFLSRYLKVFGELLFSVIWLFHVLIISLEKTVLKNEIIHEDDAQKYQKIGTIIILLIFTYNLVYLIMFVINTIQSILKILHEQKMKKQKKLLKQELVKLRKNKKPLNN